jgi:tetratricopeptide (TPR) repeat protein
MQRLADEQHNQMPMNIERRHILACLLEIPPFLLGLKSIEDILGAVDISPTLYVLNERHIDTFEYETALAAYWERSNARTATDTLEEIMQRTGNLHRQYPYAHTSDQYKMKQLLCEYHMLVADIAYDEQLNKQAIRYLDKAVKMAEENQYNELYSVALFRRGNVYFRLGGIEVTANRINFADQYFSAAISDYTRGLHGLDYDNEKQSPPLPLHIHGDILLQLGNAQTRVARSSTKESLNVIDQAEAIAQQVQEQEAKHHFTFDSYNLKFNFERYHLDRASALLGSPIRALRQPSDAIDELRKAHDIADAGLARRSVFSYILEARAYLDLKHHPIVVTTIQEALRRVTGVNSRVNIARIEGVYQSLKQTNYGNTKDVVQLGADIWKAKNACLPSRMV